MKTVGIGIIGCGGRGRGVAAGTIAAGGGRIRLVAACDTSADSIAAARKQLNPELAVYEKYRDLVRDPAVDWVMVTSWNNVHREQVVAAFEAGKNVFCEKPLATTLKDCVAIRDAWKKSGKLFAIGFTLRYSLHYLKLKEILDKGLVGDVISMEFNETLDFNHGGYIHADWRRMTKESGGHLLEKCCHDVDLVNWLLGSYARRVASFGGLDVFLPKNIGLQKRLKKSKEGHTPYAAWPSTTGLNPFTADKDIVDNQVAIIEFANGVRATFHTNCNAGIPERRMYILGTKGAIRADVLTGKIEVRKIGFHEEIQDLSTSGAGGHGGGDEFLVQELAAAMLKGKTPRTGVDDGLKSALTSLAIDKAMATGKVVDLAPMWVRAGININTKKN